ncbi:MAG TPA: glycosyltransferase family 4 protein [Erysipelotrichaceae bacterium]|nr:glycosyltransferase family 4 protein [Erysipelotrichaceae bacterium]
MIFITSLINPDDVEDIVKKYKTIISAADNKLQQAILDGLCENVENEELIVLNVPNVPSFSKNSQVRIIDSKQWNYKNAKCYQIGFVNLPILKHCLIQYNLEKVLAKFKKQPVLIYSPYLSFLRPVEKLGFSDSAAVVIADFPDLYNMKFNNRLKQNIYDFSVKKTYETLKKFKNYVLLSEHMKERLPAAEDYIVVEGMTNMTSFSGDSISFSEKAVLYSGALHFNTGIRHLIEEFQKIKSEGVELWICGSGEADEYLKQMSGQDGRIRYFGLLSLEEVKELQNKCSIMVNPRKPEMLFSRYSFPSKTFEYLVSGKPTVMYKLPSIPAEYDDYLYYIDDENSLSEIIDRIFNTDKDILLERGLKQIDFVLNEKNYITQTKKIYRFLNKDN